MSANRQLKRHHACHECRTKKLKCSGDRPICDGCKRKQDHHTASSSRRPAPECTYDFAPGEELWVHWNMPNVRSTTSKLISKLTPSPPNDHKSRRPRTPTKPPLEQEQSSIIAQRPVKPQESPLPPVGLLETPAYLNPFPTHFSPCNTFLATGLSHTHNNPVQIDGFPDSTALVMDHTMNEPFFAVGSHGQHVQGSANIHNADVTGNEYLYPTTSYLSSTSTFALLGSGMYRWM